MPSNCLELGAHLRPLLRGSGEEAERISVEITASERAEEVALGKVRVARPPEAVVLLQEPEQDRGAAARLADDEDGSRAHAHNV